jgi:hypothetical protein
MSGVRPRFRTSCLGGICALLVFVGLAVEPHLWDRGGHRHHDAGEAAGGHIHVAESHPEQPLHIEGSITSEEPHCGVCLLRGTTAEGVSRPLAGTLLALATDRWWHGHRAPPNAELAALLPARAPPASS